MAFYTFRGVKKTRHERGGHRFLRVSEPPRSTKEIPCHTKKKSTWIYAAVAIAAPAFYITNILEKIADTPVASIDYFGAMISAIGFAILASILGNIVVGMFSSKAAKRKDERDLHIGRLGFILGFFVFSILMVAPLLMAIAEVPHF
jgi:hypothetical protein